MSVTAPPPPSPPTGATASTSEACPLCGAPLHPEQEWCLSCGAAARTRLAASPGWRGPVLTLGLVLVLSLGVLTGSLVKLAGGTPTAATQTTTVTTTSAAATSTYPNGFLPGTTTTPTATTTPSVPQTTTPTTTTATTPNPTGTTTSPLPKLGKTKGKVKGPVGGVNVKRLKELLAEHLRKAGLPEQ